MDTGVVAVPHVTTTVSFWGDDFIRKIWVGLRVMKSFPTTEEFSLCLKWHCSKVKQI